MLGGRAAKDHTPSNMYAKMHIKKLSLSASDGPFHMTSLMGNKYMRLLGLVYLLGFYFLNVVFCDRPTYIWIFACWDIVKQASNYNADKNECIIIYCGLWTAPSQSDGYIVHVHCMWCVEPICESRSSSDNQRQSFSIYRAVNHTTIYMCERRCRQSST